MKIIFRYLGTYSKLFPAKEKEFICLGLKKLFQINRLAGTRGQNHAAIEKKLSAVYQEQKSKGGIKKIFPFP